MRPRGISFEEVPAHIRAMHLLVAEVAVLNRGLRKSWIAGGNGAQGWGGAWGRQVGVALEADERNCARRQHAGLAEPCGMWQAVQPSIRMGACS